jgi:hypothetical protein
LKKKKTIYQLWGGENSLHAPDELTEKAEQLTGLTWRQCYKWFWDQLKPKKTIKGFEKYKKDLR